MGAGFPPCTKNDRNCHEQTFGSWAVLDAAVLLVELERRLSALRGNVTPARSKIVLEESGLDEQVDDRIVFLHAEIARPAR